MPELINRKTGERELVDPENIADALASKKYVAPNAIAVNSLGTDTYASPEQFEQDKTFAQAIDPAKVALAQGHKIREDANTGIVATGKALFGGAVSGLTADIVSPFEESQEFNRAAATVGTLGGAILPGFFGEEAGVAGAIAKDGVAAERATAGLSSKFLYGGELGHEVGTTGRAVERGIAGAGRDLDVAQGALSVPEDLAGLDTKGLRAAEGVHRDELAAAQVADRAAAKSSVVDDMIAYRKTVKEANPFLVIDEGEDAARLNKANRFFRDALDDEKGLRENPSSLAKPLRKEEKSIENAIANREEIAAKLEKVNAKIAKSVGADLEALAPEATELELTGKAARRYGSYADVKVGRDATVKVAREDAQSFVEAIERGEVQGAAQQSLGKLDELLAQNRALQQKIGGAVAPMTPKAELTSARMKAILDAKDAIATPAGKSLAEDMLGGTIMGHVAGKLSGLPIIGPAIGAKVGRLVGDAVFGRMGKGIAESGARTADAVSSFLNVAKRATPTLPIAATRVLSNLKYGPGPASQAKDLPMLYKARANEIKALTMLDETGKPVMRPEARAAMAARLAPIRAASPVAADRMETIAARKIEFLASKLVKRPDIGGMQTGPDKWHPSDMEMRQFARYAHAVEDPHGVEERLATGNITPEDAEAYRTVYPERFEALKQEIVAKLPLLQKSLPYPRRLALSLFTGIAVDPSMNPAVLAVLQGSFAIEAGTAGGTQAPVAQPQFGSVSKQDPTPAQRRAEGAT